jgi:hypothetical protein
MGTKAVKLKIKWVSENPGNTDPGERGYWQSMEGRFCIYPSGFRNTATPDGFAVADRIAIMDTRKGPSSAKFDTVRECKAWALVRALQDMGHHTK